MITKEMLQEARQLAINERDANELLIKNTLLNLINIENCDLCISEGYKSFGVEFYAVENGKKSFGSGVTIYYNKETWGTKEDKFEVDYGTIGSFNPIEDKSQLTKALLIQAICVNAEKILEVFRSAKFEKDEAWNKLSNEYNREQRAIELAKKEEEYNTILNSLLVNERFIKEERWNGTFIYAIDRITDKCVFVTIYKKYSEEQIYEWASKRIDKKEFVNSIIRKELVAM